MIYRDTVIQRYKDTKKVALCIILLVSQYLNIFVSPAFASDKLYFIHTDHLGSTVAVTDENGEIVSQSRHFPYGSDHLPVTDYQLPVTERNYTSQIQDRETSLYYYNARYYDPALGIFVSADSAGASLNRFGYVGGNPLNYIDPSGHDLMLIGGAAGDFDPGGHWKEWIKAYEGWGDDEWDTFYAGWESAVDKDIYLNEYQIRIFSWGGGTLDERLAKAKSALTTEMLTQLNDEMVGQDLTVLALSKGGALMLEYLQAVADGTINPSVTPLNVVLLAPATSWSASRARSDIVRVKSVPETSARVVNVCSGGDRACMNTLRDAENINSRYGSGSFFDYIQNPERYHHSHQQCARAVLAGLDVQGNRGSGFGNNLSDEEIFRLRWFDYYNWTRGEGPEF